MSAIYPPIDNIFGGHATGPPEAFYPFMTEAANGATSQDSATSSFEDDIEVNKWDLGDLFNFAEATSEVKDNADEEDESSSSPTGVDATSSPDAQPTTAGSEDQVHPLLDHFKRGGDVGAFRRNQRHHQLIASMAVSQESLAFSGPHGQGPLRGIKGGRLAAVNTPLSPLRRSKAAKTDVKISPTMEPEIETEKKRKFSGEQHSHKRSRSMI